MHNAKAACNIGQWILDTKSIRHCYAEPRGAVEAEVEELKKNPFRSKLTLRYRSLISVLKLNKLKPWLKCLFFIFQEWEVLFNETVCFIEDCLNHKIQLKWRKYYLLKNQFQAWWENNNRL